MQIYSHRGESRYAPENTMSSFYLAYLLHSDGIECDVRKSKDGKFVIIHDKTINRTSNGKGNVSAYTLNQLKEYNFGNKKYIDEKVVTLDEFLDIFSNKDIKIFLEIKEENVEDQIWQILSKYNLNNITIISFKYSVLCNFRRLSSILKLGWLVYDIDENVINKTLNKNINIILCNCISLNKKNIKLINNVKLKIGAWGVKNKAELRRLQKLDIDVVVYDSYYDAKKELKNE